MLWSSPTTICILHILFHFSPYSTNSLFNQLFNDWWWLTQVGLWGAYNRDNTIWSYISSCNHKNIINSIPIKSNGYSSLITNPNHILDELKGHFHVWHAWWHYIVPTPKKNKLEIWMKKINPNNIQKVSKSTYNEYHISTINKQLHLFSSIFLPYMCFRIQLYWSRLTLKLCRLQNKSILKPYHK